MAKAHFAFGKMSLKKMEEYVHRTDAPCFLPKLSKQGHNSRKDKVVKSGKKTWSSIYDP
jgi:esterase/lipase